MDRIWEKHHIKQAPLWSLLKKTNTVKQLYVRTTLYWELYEMGGGTKCLGGCTHHMEILDHFIPGCSHLHNQGVVMTLIENTPVVCLFKQFC